jgi:anti-sigma B factor antagonist
LPVDRRRGGAIGRGISPAWKGRSLPPAAKLELSEAQLDDRIHVIAVAGEIHISTARPFAHRLTTAIGDGASGVVIDLSRVAFIDSTGLSVLLNALRRVTLNQGRLALVCTNPTVLRLFEITHLDETFDIAATRAEAVQRVRQPAGGSSAGAP